MTIHKIGETFWWHEDPDTNIRLKVVVDYNEIGCLECYFRNCCVLPSKIQDNIEPCSERLRPDHTDIHFEEIE